MIKASVEGVLAKLDSKTSPCVYVMTRWGTEYHGNLVFSDRFMNIELEQVRETVKGVKIRIISHLMLRPQDLVTLRAVKY